MSVSMKPASGGGFALTVDNPQYFIKVATSGGRVRNSQTDNLFGVDYEHSSDGEGDTLGIAVGGVLVVQHVVQGGDFTILVGDLEYQGEYPPLECSPRSPTYDGVADAGWAELGTVLFDIFHPSIVCFEVIGREPDELYATSVKVAGTTGDFTKLSGANWGKVIYERGPISSWGSAMEMKSHLDERREWPMVIIEMGVSVLSI